MSREVFAVGIDLPPGATAADAERYVREAVKIHRGGMDPREPMSGLNVRRVSVRRAIPPTQFLTHMWNASQGDDPEHNHGVADSLMGEQLRRLGFHAAVEVFESMETWYA